MKNKYKIFAYYIGYQYIYTINKKPHRKVGTFAAFKNKKMNKPQPQG